MPRVSSLEVFLWVVGGLIGLLAIWWALTTLGGKLAKPHVEAAVAEARPAQAQADTAQAQLKNSNTLGTSLEANQKATQSARQAVTDAPDDRAAHDAFVTGLRDLQRRSEMDALPSGPQAPH